MRTKLLHILLPVALVLVFIIAGSLVAYAIVYIESNDTKMPAALTTTDTGVQSTQTTTLNLTETLSVATPDAITASRANNKSLTIKWNKVKDAKGYEVFRLDSTNKDYIKVKTVYAPAHKWTNKKLKTNKTYKYKVRAYTIIDNQIIYGDFTYVVSAKVYSKSAKSVNAGSLRLEPKTLYLGLNDKVELKAKVAFKIKPSKYGSAKTKSVIDKKLRWICKPNAVIDLDNKGYITGKQLGSANIYALTHNGTLKKLKVYVVDFAKPQKWYFEEPVEWQWGLENITPELTDLLTKQRDELTTIAAFFDMHHSKADATAYRNGTIFSKYPEGPDIEKAIAKLEKECPYPISIPMTTNNGVGIALTFEMFTGDAVIDSVAFSFRDFDVELDTFIAPRWTFNVFVGY